MELAKESTSGMERMSLSMEESYESDAHSIDKQAKVEEIEEINQGISTPISATSPKLFETDMSWLRKLEHEMDKKMILDTSKINERVQRRKKQEEEMQQSLASFTSHHSASNSVESSNDSSHSSKSNSSLKLRTKEQVDEWKEAFTEDGKKYFYNRRTRETSWTCPENAILVKPSVDIPITQTQHTNDSIESVDDHPEQIISPLSISQSKKTMYCMFCGHECRVWELMQHMSSCSILLSNQENRTAMYEEAVDVMNELFPKQAKDAETQTTDKFLHYASVYSVHSEDVKSSPPVDPFALLHRRRHTTHVLPRTTDINQFQHDSKQNHGKLKQTSESFQSRQYLTEECRYCHRSFAEGRLIKHEAVCPRVFGNEGIWNVSKKEIKQQPIKTKKYKNNHSLTESFQEHQASLITCPSCTRKFAPSGAQQHIEICQQVENKPKKFKGYTLAC